MKIWLAAAIVVLALVSTSCACVLRTGPFIRGTIVDVGNGWLDVRHKSGRVLRVVTTATAATAALKPNVTAFIELEVSRQGLLVAREIRVGGPGN